MRRAVPALIALGVALTGCKRGGSDAAPSASGASAPAPPSSETVTKLTVAEHARHTPAIDDLSLSSRDPVVRRRAARALARIADEPAARRLEEALADEDPGVVAWAAYGLGYACNGREPASVRALVSRAASLEANPPARPSDVHPELWSPIAAIADALARCGTIEAEHTLRVWLDGQGERAEAAALALGRLASRSKRLDDASIVALLDAASRDKPVSGALFAFSRLSVVAEPVRERLLAVARDGLRGDGQRRAFAVRAIARAGAGAVEPLIGVVQDDQASPSLRAVAARELGKLGEPAQRALAGALGKLVSEKPEPAELLGNRWQTIAAVLETLTSLAREDRPLFEQLAKLPVDKSSSPAVKRRLVEIRCRSAALLAGSQIAHPALSVCDPDADGRIGKLALLRVLAREPLTGTRLRRFRELALAKDPVVRQSALELLATHSEVAGAWELLAAGLRDARAGTVAVAARVLADHPQRAQEEPEKEGDPVVAVKPQPAVIEALEAAFGVKRPADAVETRAALIDAAGALQVMRLKPKVAAHCSDENPTLRLAAEKALRLLGERNRQCKHAGPSKSPKQLGLSGPDELKIALETDVGELGITLDARLAPVTAARIADLVRSGFYDGIVFHRVVPGFVVQFGDPGGDGFGGANREPLRCETSPATFGPNSVGIALAGRDTGSSQLFVTLDAYPHLDGDYPLVGRASAGFERIAQGDVIHKARIVGD